MSCNNTNRLIKKCLIIFIQIIKTFINQTNYNYGQQFYMRQNEYKKKLLFICNTAIFFVQIKLLKKLSSQKVQQLKKKLQEISNFFSR